ncbi:phage terminase large subunit family protein [Spirochaeta cellobiosiphila]|uniref:phage terminase large subunit family protein n=1 Tax=Spirochaeta cellobiosiphila TaxID=504483 RepID=UPI000423329F|nr:phage terminase large subunit family protein [Spirochaeta cellobiosiphila]
MGKTPDQQWVQTLLSKYISPGKKLTVTQWANANRYLSKESSAEPGIWRTSRTPFLKGIMDSLSDPKVKETWFMKGSQTGGTEAGNNWLGFIIDHAPGPAMMIMGDEQSAKDNSLIRIDPMIENSPSLRSKVRSAREQDSGNTRLMKRFPGGYLSIISARSASKLRSKPIKYLFADEVDSYPGDVGGEGDPVKLAQKRLRTFTRAKSFAVSTPTIKGHSRIEKGYEQSDRRKYHVPCPHCGAKQELIWEQIKYTEDNPYTTYYECKSCKAKIHEHHKEKLLREGVWVATNPKAREGIVGFHLSSLYSPWTSWAEVVQIYLDSKDDPAAYITFVNHELGLPYEDKGEAPAWEKLFYRKGGYLRGQVPDGVLFLTAGVDIQQDRIECEVVGWGRGKESWSIDYFIFLGDTSTKGTGPWKELSELLERQFERVSGGSMPIWTMAIDQGYRKTQVFDFCMKYTQNRVIPVKGSYSLQSVISRPQPAYLVVSGKKTQISLYRYDVGDGIIKSEIYSYLKSEPEEGEYPPGYCHFPENYDESYFQMLTAEQLVQRENSKTKVITFAWEKIRERNESLDCRKYARSAAALRGIDSFSDKIWSQMEACYPTGEEKVQQNYSTKPRKTARKGRKIYSSGIRS